MAEWTKRVLYQIKKYRWWICYGGIYIFAIFLISLGVHWIALRFSEEQRATIYFFANILLPIIASLVTIVFTARREYNLKKSHDEEIKGRKKKLEEETEAWEKTLEELSISTVNSYLRKIVGNLPPQGEQGNEFGANERICIYKYVPKKSPEKDIFKCVGRHSGNGAFLKLVDRDYSRSQGFISNIYDRKNRDWEEDKAFPHISDESRSRIRQWQDGEADNRTEDDIVALDSYQEYIKEKYRIPQDVYKSFRMNAEHMIAKQLWDSDKKILVGVIVFESCHKNFLSLESIQNACTENDIQYIINLM